MGASNGQNWKKPGRLLVFDTTGEKNKKMSDLNCV